MTEQPTTSLYDAVGGEKTFRKIVHGFYTQVKEDDLIGPMYPQDDWEGAENRLTWFLVQYWGGPKTYQTERGHPRLRMRHNPYTIDGRAAERWLGMMKNSLDQIDSDTLPDEHRTAIWNHMERAALMVINAPQ